MAVYTTQVKSIVEQINAENGFSPSSKDAIKAIEERISNARESIFSFSYPINEEDKLRFETSFIRHFYMREIGLETYTLWRLRLADKLNLLIPKYNKLWEEASKYKDIDLLSDKDYTIAREFDGNRDIDSNENINTTRTDNTAQDRTGSDTDTSNIDHVRAYSDTPQGNMENLLSERYLTNLTHDYENGSTKETKYGSTIKNTGTVTNRGTNAKDENIKDKQSETIKHTGKSGGMTYAEAILKARETYINIDYMFFKELNDLFMLIW